MNPDNRRVLTGRDAANKSVFVSDGASPRVIAFDTLPGIIFWVPMHTTDTLDYGVVIRGEIILELDDGKTAHMKQGDCVVQNGTRHRWSNPLAEPCLIASS